MTGFEALVHFVDDVDTTATANDLIVAMPGAQRFDGIFDFHSGHPSHSKKLAPAGAENSLRFLYGQLRCLSTFSNYIHDEIAREPHFLSPLAAHTAASGVILTRQDLFNRVMLCNKVTLFDLLKCRNIAQLFRRKL